MTPNTHWVDAVKKLSDNGDGYVLVTLLGVRGSSPRDSGSKMVVSQQTTFDTIGGGHLEHQATKIAQKMLLDSESGQHIEHFPLGAKLGQCCGGAISVLFESFVPNYINIMLFGAGHVAHDIVPMLAGLPVRVTWVDERAELFPKAQYNNVQQLVSDTPADEVAEMPANSYYLVLTHNHQRDFEIASAILTRQDFTYLGLIGSKTKWQRFVQRFKHRDFSAEQIDNIRCPVGLSDVPGKLPMEVAVSIVGEIINAYQATKTPTAHKQGIDWSELKSILADNEIQREGRDEQ